MRCQTKWTGRVMGVILGLLFSAVVVLAGGLEPLVGPTAAGSQMYTLDQIYDLINNGTAATKMTTFAEPGNGPTAGTKHTLDEIYDLVGQRAPVPRTGQTPTLPLNPASAGSDGALQKGVAWPNPRFTDNNNGSVTDNLTGLIWLKNANCFGTRTWAVALADASNLASGNCGLIDGSTAGQWRMPNVKELQSLIDYAWGLPALSNAAGTGRWTPGNPFIGVQSDIYWSSTMVQLGPGFGVWVVSLIDGEMRYGIETVNTYYVWPVRGGQ